MKNRERLSCWIHHSMAVVGGYLGVYTLLCRADFFGNAQTCNLIYIVTSLFGHNFFDVLLRIIGAAIFFLGISLTVFLSKKTQYNLKHVSWLINCITVLFLGFLPKELNPVVGLYPLFFATAIQWNSFPGAYGFVSSTIFSTNNLRQLANSTTEYCITHEPRQKEKAIFFGGTIACYHIGVAFSVFTHLYFDIQSVWLCFLPLALSGVLIMLEHRMSRQPEPSKVNP
ncbi:MAG: YoaK family protein [Butyricicoccaceae bacterium]